MNVIQIYANKGARISAMVLTREGLEDWLHVTGDGVDLPRLTLSARYEESAYELFEILRGIRQPIAWCPNALAGPLRVYFDHQAGDTVMSWPKPKEEQ